VQAPGSSPAVPAQPSPAQDSPCLISYQSHAQAPPRRPHARPGPGRRLLFKPLHSQLPAVPPVQANPPCFCPAPKPATRHACARAPTRPLPRAPPLFGAAGRGRRPPRAPPAFVFCPTPPGQVTKAGLRAALPKPFRLPSACGVRRPDPRDPGGPAPPSVYVSVQKNPTPPCLRPSVYSPLASSLIATQCAVPIPFTRPSPARRRPALPQRCTGQGGPSQSSGRTPSCPSRRRPASPASTCLFQAPGCRTGTQMRAPGRQ
jgi:hypothetical protein